MINPRSPCSRTIRRARVRISIGDRPAVSSINSLRSLSMLTAEVRRGQSSSSRRPERTLVWSMRPSEDSIRMISDSPGISSENTSTALSLRITAFSTRFMAKVVLPIDGRPATIIRSAGCKPDVMLSSSVKPVDRPVMEPSLLNSVSMRSIALVSSALTPSGPPVLGRLSAIEKILRSASSSTSVACIPLGLKAVSAISVLTLINWRRVERSRMICA